MFRLVVFTALLTCCFHDVSAEVAITEDDFVGGFSTNHSAPTSIGTLALGTTTIEGATVYISPFEEPDIITFSVAANQQLDSIMLAIEDDRHFWAIGPGTQIGSQFADVANMLQARLIGSGDEFDNLLTDVPQTLYGGTGLSSPLGPGDYTIWLQENTVEGVYAYTYTFQTSEVSSIPEPSSLLALCFAGSCVALRRRRK